MPSAIGRSKDGPSFLMSAGARLIVVRPSGNLYPDVLSAVLTRSRDSRTAASGSPTITTTVSPHPENTSTSTTNASMPLTAAEHTLANTGSGYAGIYRELQCANLRLWDSEIACGARLQAWRFSVSLLHSKLFWRQCLRMQLPKLENLRRALSLFAVRINVRRIPYPPHWRTNQTAAEIPGTIGEHIKQRRLQLRLLQREVAEQLGVSTVSISNWERGVGEPSRRLRSRIRQFLACNTLGPPVTFSSP